MKNFYEQIIKHLEILIENGHMQSAVVLFYKDNKFVGFQLDLAKDKKGRPGEEIKESIVIELYLDIKEKLGINQKSSMLKALRLNYNLSQQDLGNLIGKSRREIFRWESGVEPREENMELLLKALEARNDNKIYQIFKTPRNN